MARATRKDRRNPVGEVFGRLTVLRVDGKHVVCRCSCGTPHRALASNVLYGRTSSCGCLLSEARHKPRSAFAQHPLRCTWRAMLSRCENPSNSGFAGYGGRGITVCARWHDFQAFLADMGERPSPAHSLDRINNDGNYEPSNCRWATQKEQARNTRRNVWLTHEGRSMLATDWARELGVSRQRMEQRLRQYRDVPEKLFAAGNRRSVRIGKRNARLRKIGLTVGTKTQSLSAWAAAYDMSAATLRSRIRRGMSALDALTAPVGPRGRKRALAEAA